MKYILIVVAFLSRETNSACIESDQALWFQSKPFGVKFEEIAKSSMGIKLLAKNKFAGAYPAMTEGCRDCFAEMLACGAEHCRAQCIISRLDLSCRQCVDRHCMPPFKACTGYSNEDDLPLPPWKL